MTTDDKIREAFENYAATFDTYGNKWQDMGADKYFEAGYRAALSSLEQVATMDEADEGHFADLLPDRNFKIGEPLYRIAPTKIEGDKP